MAAADLEALLPRILAIGAGGLVWRRLRTSGLRDSAAGRKLQQSHRCQRLQALGHECRLELLVSTFRAAGLEPLVLKGWSSARLYPEAGLRPCGDIDVCVSAEEVPQAVTVLMHNAGRFGLVDVHGEIADLPDRSWKELLRRSRLVRLGGQAIRILGPEDQLRQLCLHLLRHGAFWPLWLCDVAAAIEGRGKDFDWEYFLKGDTRLSRWAMSALGLAGGILGARFDHPCAAEKVPEWMIAATLAQWGADDAGDSHSRDTRPLWRYWRQPVGILKALRRRWPNPIEAAFRMRVHPQASVPPAWFQFRAVAARALRFSGSLCRQRANAHLFCALHRGVKPVAGT
jgi:hypothetical protein